jgi:hypothetical protein
MSRELDLMANDERWKMANGRWQMEDGKWKMANGRWQMEDGLLRGLGSAAFWTHKFPKLPVDSL